MNAPTTALVPVEGFADTTRSGNFTVLTPRRQAAFLEHLMVFGTVRLACRAAGVSPQTAYRARRASAGFARGWDAALLSARTRAEEVLASRALDGVEEKVFYHGEEVATRRRYDSRLLLAHIARLDRLEERPEIAATLPELDALVEGLRRGEAIPDAPLPEPAATPTDDRAEISPQDTVPGVPSCRICGGICGPLPHDPDRPGGSFEDRVPPHDYPFWEDAMDDPGNWVFGRFYPDFGAVLDAMAAARPAGAPDPARHGGDAAAIRSLQWEAFDHDLDGWWAIVTEADLAAAYDADDAKCAGLWGSGEGEGARAAPSAPSC
ncbi:hypothetical protein MKP08_09155 [Erythrobacter sp. LQ02-29]|uniref:hypothetical protein n=1 Tax=Erythrobacter sp. LQ02-29 TaxID=2920384 RepID=UPI001F4E2C44|nr:hypothetical protein [Erythrobacter sp. LQ02-29]MCP9222913.1 hypothetical protein [Erythrobacter sp. LQ02-29]